MIDGPTSHGSKSIVKDPGNNPGDDNGATAGLKTSKNDVSPFSDLTDSDIAKHTQQRVSRTRRSRHEERGKQAVSSKRQPAWFKIVYATMREKSTGRQLLARVGGRSTRG